MLSPKFRVKAINWRAVIVDIPKKRNRVYRIFSRHFSYKMRGRFNFKWQINIMPIRTFKNNTEISIA